MSGPDDLVRREDVEEARTAIAALRSAMRCGEPLTPKLDAQATRGLHALAALEAVPEPTTDDPERLTCEQAIEICWALSHVGGEVARRAMVALYDNGYWLVRAEWNRAEEHPSEPEERAPEWTDPRIGFIQAGEQVAGRAIPATNAASPEDIARRQREQSSAAYPLGVPPSMQSETPNDFASEPAAPSSELSPELRERLHQAIVAADEGKGSYVDAVLSVVQDAIDELRLARNDYRMSFEAASRRAGEAGDRATRAEQERDEWREASIRHERDRQDAIVRAERAEQALSAILEAFAVYEATSPAFAHERRGDLIAAVRGAAKEQTR